VVAGVQDGSTRQVVDFDRPHFSMWTSSDSSASWERRVPTSFEERPMASAMFFERK